ncbi:hypothetical protein GH733_013014 [Mirounga leonina]|nr:hypothetical protein GH733_013014 [Mirounga leonina]
MAETMAESYNRESEPTTRTLLRRVLDTADTRTPRRRRSARVRLAHVHTSGNLEEQTPRTLLKNILLTAPESSIMMPESVVKPVPTPQVVQSSRRESSRGSSLNLTFATPLQPQSVQRPGLARRPPTRRAVDVGAFLQDLRDTSLALASPGDSLRTPVATVQMDTVLEDTQPFSQPLVGRSPSVYHSLPCTEAEDAERAVSHRTQSSGPRLQNHNPRKPAQLLAAKAKKVDALAVSFPNNSSAISGEDGVEPLQDGVGEEAEERMEEGLSVSKVMDTTGTQGSVRTEKSKGYREMTEAVEAKDPEGSSGDEDISGRTEPPEPLSTRLPPRARTPGPRPRQDPHKTGLSHYVKFFSFYSKMPMEKAALEMVEKCLDKYFQHLCDDLEVFAAHAGRKTVRPEDLELLMRRQGLVNDQVSLHVLVERHLPLEYRQLLIPCAFSGNSVFPAQ